MDGGRIDRDSDLGDDSPMSHIDEHSDREDDIRDCDSSDEGVNVNQSTTLPAGIDFGRSPEHHSDIMNQSSHFGTNHPLGVLGNLTALNMGVQNLQSLQNLQHGDVLEKLKMQVRDMKVGLIDQDYPLNTFGGSMQSINNNAYSQAQNLTQSQSQASNGGYPFTSPTAPISKDGNPGSNSSTSSETSNSSQQNNGWSFEEQFKQVRQLYEINDDPKRKEFLDDLFLFMQKRGTPINRLPIMAKSVLDLYELYNLVIARGGLVDVINKKLWQEIIKGLHLPSSITSAAFTLRTQYMKYLYPYECEKKNLSSPSELQAAIDGNRREGRRSSYGQFDSQMQGQLQMSSLRRSPGPPNMQQMSPLSLVTHGGNPAAHHRLMGAPPVGNLPNIVPHEIEQRMLEYIKLFQNQKEPMRSQSPEPNPRDAAMTALEMSRVALWSMYTNNNNTSPPNSLNPSPPELQREALNLSDSPQHHISIKRERDHPLDYVDRDRDFSPPPKRNLTTSATTPQQQQIKLKKNSNNNNNNTNNNNNNSSSNNNNINNDEDNHALNSPIRENGDHHHSSLSSHHHHNHHHLEHRHRHKLLSQQHQQQEHPNHMDISSSPSSGKAQQNGNGEQQNGGGVGSNGGGTGVTVLNGMQFKIISKGNAATGDQQLVVTMEVNGISYEGVLFANQSSTSTSSSLSTISSAQSDTTAVTPSPTKTLNTNSNNNTSSNSIEDRPTLVQRPLVSS